MNHPKHFRKMILNFAKLYGVRVKKYDRTEKIRKKVLKKIIFRGSI